MRITDLTAEITILSKLHKQGEGENHKRISDLKTKITSLYKTHKQNEQKLKTMLKGE